MQELGSGGMGTVFLVHDAYLERNVALKLVRRPLPSDDGVAHLEREFELLSRVEHPNIARAHDFGRLRGLPYFTREYIAGRTLDDDRVAAEPGRFLHTASRIAEAVAFLHRHQILHLDLKPGNIILRGDGGARDEPVIIDFGLFRRSAAIPADDRLRGSLAYMAPEYFDGQAVGPWTDVYAIGVTLYRILTGTFPRATPPLAPDPGRRTHVWDPTPPPPSRRGRAVPEAVDAILLRCLALDPTSRFPDAEALFQTLQGVRVANERAIEVTTDSRLGFTVGRDLEMSRALDFADDRSRGRAGPSALLVTGSLGVGQSHFLTELKVRIQTRGVACYLETGYPGRASTPGRLFRFLGNHLGRGARGPRSRWENFLRRLRRPRETPRTEITEGERRLRRASEGARALRHLREPVVLIIDGLEHCDEVSVGLLHDLVVFLDGVSPESRPPFAVVVAYREEGPAVELLRELSRHLLRGNEPGAALTLQPLSVEDGLSLFLHLGGRLGEGESALSLHQTTRGMPRSIEESVAEASPATDAPESAATSPETSEPAAARDEDDLRLLLGLVLLRRPAPASQLARVVDRPRTSTLRRLRRLCEDGEVADLDEDAGRTSWIATATGERRVAGVSGSPRRAMHVALAGALLRAARSEPGEDLVEAVHHFEQAGRLRAVAEHGARAARYLKSTAQNRRALQRYQGALDALPRSATRKRLQIALEMAELYRQVGRLEEGIALLRSLTPVSRALSRRWHGELLMALASLHCHRGDFRMAASLSVEADRLTRRARPGLPREKRLAFLNDRAAIQSFLGHYDEALRLCGEGLAEAKGSRSARQRELAMDLHATRANVALRRYDFEAATRDFEVSLEIAEKIGSETNRAVVLNNLGIVLSQQDRYRDAIRSLREAERTSLRLDEGPSLVSIYANLAILYGKLGDHEAATTCLGEAKRLDPGEVGRRQAFFLEHAAGLCLLFRGRYAEARERLETALRLGSAIGDEHVTAYDALYAGEASLFEGRHEDAARELERLAGAQFPVRLRKAALSRLALLRARLGESSAPKELLARYEKLKEERRVPSLDAIDEIFLAWALSIAACELSAEEEREQRLGVDEFLNRAEAFFRRHGLRPALSLGLWVSAENCFLRGEPERALRKLAALEAGAWRSDLLEILHPLLRARILMEMSTTAEERGPVADLLSEAGVALLSNPLPEWSERHAALRAALGASPEGGQPRRKPRTSYESRWMQGFAIPAGEGAGILTAVAARDDETRPLTRWFPGDAASPGAEILVQKAPSTRRLAREIGRIARLDLAVLIEGETGSGKEFVARCLHRQSRRADAPLVVVDCGALNPSLFEVELFGAVSGAYTSLDEDREGILQSAAGGTVLWDGIGDCHSEVQARLLRVLEGVSFRRLGSSEQIHLDVRFLFSTAVDLAAAVAGDRFRADLYHRIHGLSVRVPPLRERAEDIPDLVRMILAERTGEPPELEAAALDKLRELPWRGNVRELRNFVLRASLESTGRIRAETIERSLPENGAEKLSFPRNLLASQELPDLIRRLERDYLLHHLRRLDGDSRKLCDFLGLSRRQLYRRCARLGVRLSEERLRR